LKVELTTTSQIEFEPQKVYHLSEIENPEISKDDVIRVEGVISSTSISYRIPRVVTGTWTTREGLERSGEYTIEKDDPLCMLLTGVSSGRKHSELARVLGAGSNALIEDVGYRTVYKVRVRPPVFTLEKKGEKIVDEEGREYKPFDVYVVSEEMLDLTPSTHVILMGKVFPDPKSQKATLLAFDIDYPNTFGNFDRQALETLYAKFQGMPVASRLAWIVDNFEVYSHIVGRRNLAISGFLAFFSPVWLEFNRDIQRGWANDLLIGDTTTGKSQTVKKLILLLRNGMLITAETATAVGLTGTATQMERGEWFVEWGLLPLNDRKLLAIDGAQKLKRSEWASLAESERSGVVIKSSAAKGSAYARTRQIKIANPVDLEDKGNYGTKEISAFYYPIQAVATVLDKTGIARLDLAVLSDKRTVKAEDVNKLNEGNYDPDLELLSEALKWAWSGYAKIEFTQEAVHYILNKATKLSNKYQSGEIPLVSIDMAWKIARQSAALATLTLSTNPDFDKIIVTEEHAIDVSTFLEDEYKGAGLDNIALREVHELPDRGDLANLLFFFEETLGIPDEKARQILQFMVLKQRFTKDELQTTFSLAEKNQIRPLTAKLSSEGYVSRGRGFYATPKLNHLAKLMNGGLPE